MAVSYSRGRQPLSQKPNYIAPSATRTTKGKSAKKAAKKRKLSTEAETAETAETRDTGNTRQNDSQDEEMRDDTPDRHEPACNAGDTTIQSNGQAQAQARRLMTLLPAYVLVSTTLSARLATKAAETR
jgi:hypothetical protein